MLSIAASEEGGGAEFRSDKCLLGGGGFGGLSRREKPEASARDPIRKELGLQNMLSITCLLNKCL